MAIFIFFVTTASLQKPSAVAVKKDDSSSIMYINCHLNAQHMSIALVTGSAGLIGSETCKRFHAEGFDIVGVDNDMRAQFFGAEASTAKNRALLEKSLKNYQHESSDIRDADAMEKLFARLGADIKVIIHTAA